MKKKISLILAFLMAASMLAGCKKTDEDSSGLPDVGGADSVSLTQMTTTEETTTTTEATTTTETTTEETEETEETAETTSETEQTGETSTAAADSSDWKETEISETMYVSTACYSRERAIVGSEAVKKYEAGTKIEIVAITDTGYYKLADGTFIHSDYVTDRAPAAQTTTAAPTTTAKKTEATTKPAPTPDDDTSSEVGSGGISSSYTKSYKNRYPYQQLNSAEQELYRNIVDAATNFKRKVHVPDGLLSDDVFKVYCIVFNNEPQLFWLSTSAPSGYGSISLDYEFTRDEAAEIQKNIDATVNEIMKSVNGYTSTVSKLKVIHDWVITHNTFSLQGTYETCGIYNGLGGHGALQCQGYAKTTQYLCDMAGIDCMTVVGNNTAGSTHAWNVVYCENGYYILDTTWDDPMNEKNKSSYIRYVLFLANDDMIKNSHLNQSTATRGNGNRVKLYNPPSCTSSACYYFKAYNKEYSDLDSAVAALYAEFDTVLKSGTQAVHIRVTSHDLWTTLTSDEYTKTFQKYAKSKDSNVKAISRQKTLTEDINVVEFDIQYN
ncbi:MAG: hypothetical protein J1F11_07815 [Oscillospiraceae bacterium]|nr:hypothetical protein [Oscillospiraceae bacterium]